MKVTKKYGRNVVPTITSWQLILLFTHRVKVVFRKLNKGSKVDGFGPHPPAPSPNMYEGRRKQTKRDPRTFIYYRRFENLSEPYDTILVFIAFRYNYTRDKDEFSVNNFVTTAWGDVSTS